MCLCVCENISHVLTAPIYIKQNRVTYTGASRVLQKYFWTIIFMNTQIFIFLICFLVFSSTYSWPGEIPCHFCRAHSLQKLVHSTVDHMYNFSSLYTEQLLYCNSCLFKWFRYFLLWFQLVYYITYLCSLFLTTCFTLVSSIFLGNACIKNFIEPS